MRELFNKACKSLIILVGMVKDKLLSMAEAAKRFGVSEKEFAKLAKV